MIPKFISLYPIHWRNGAAQHPSRHEARALIAIEKARAASRLRASTGEEGVARDLLAPAMAISSIAVDTVFEGKRKISPTTRTVLITDMMMLEREAALKPAR